jgi:hypothetical protein
MGNNFCLLDPTIINATTEYHFSHKSGKISYAQILGCLAT